VLYENMIAPLIPYTTRGVIWYQGEANADRPDEYRILFPALIDAWRTAWNRPDWPFFFVQLAAYGETTPSWKELCAAQTFTRDTVKNTGMALAIDCGDKTNIHPPAKQPVGERLARLALDQVYQQKVVSRGPAVQTLEKTIGTVRVVFQGSENGLKTSDGKAEIPGFELAGADGKFYPAQARLIAKDTVELTCPEVQKPETVRYAWATWPEPPVTLQNSAGLPTEPFKQIITGNVQPSSSSGSPGGR
jgi:sialate O-acetylesterase